MKSCLFFLIFIQTNAFTQESKQIQIQLIEDCNLSSGCKTIYYANGRTTITEQELPNIDLPNTIAVNPSQLTFNDQLIFHSYAQEAAQLGSIELDEFQLVPFSRDEVIELIKATEDSAYWDWKIRDEDYLRKNFGIVYDAKPLPKPIETDTITIEPFGRIVGGALIEERRYVRIEPIRHKHIPESFRSMMSDPNHTVNFQQLDSVLQPFYFSNYEVTNAQYRKFVHWVVDSIELHMAYLNLAHHDASQLLNCTNKERKELDSTKRMENLVQFGLTRKKQTKIDEGNWVRATMDLYYPQPMRYFKRREKNPKFFIYKQSDTTMVSIYPDTTGFDQPEIGGQVLSMAIGNLTWHPAYEDYPVVNVNRDQIMAYCHWKQRQMNEEYASKGYRITVRPPTITEYEFATKTSLGPAGYFSALDQSNDHFTVNVRSNQQFEFPFYQSVRYNPCYFSKKRMSCDNNASLNYKQWYQANKSESPVKFLNGNVSEFVMDSINEKKWNHYKINSPIPKSSANFILGSNYYMDVKSLGDDQYNAIFFKSALENGTSSPLIGFRLVYLVNKVP